MFGKHWIAGRGLVVDKRTASTTSDGMVSIYEFVVEVTTASGEVFRAKAEEPHIATNFKDPSIGDTVGIEYDEKSRDVRFDKDDPQLSWKAWKKAQATTSAATFDASLHATPGTPIGASAPIAAAGFDIGALLKLQGVDISNATPQVIQMDGSTPDAAALREALLKMLGQQPPAEPPTSEQG